MTPRTPRSDTPIRAHTPLGPGNEFDAVRSLLTAWESRAQGIGDDAATIALPSGERLVVSTDTSVENVHFRRDWLTPHEIGWRATTAALSDLAAMGATPLGLLVAMVIPPTWRDQLPALGDGIGAAAAAAASPIVGGDTTTGGELSITVTVLGSTRLPIHRRGARAGDAVWVTGALGGPGAALRAWLDGKTPSPELHQRFVRPEARIPHGHWLAMNYAHAGIDISDGLIADARHLAAASGVEISITLDAVPVIAGCTPMEAAGSGEEYELLIAAAPTLDARAFAERFELPLTKVGDVIGPSENPGVIVTLDGVRVEFAGGYDHFSR